MPLWLHILKKKTSSDRVYNLYMIIFDAHIHQRMVGVKKSQITAAETIFVHIFHCIDPQRVREQTGEREQDKLFITKAGSAKTI